MFFTIICIIVCFPYYVYLLLYQICRCYRTYDITLYGLAIIGWAIGLDYITCKGILYILAEGKGKGNMAISKGL